MQPGYPGPAYAPQSYTPQYDASQQSFAQAPQYPVEQPQTWQGLTQQPAEDYATQAHPPEGGYVEEQAADASQAPADSDSQQPAPAEPEPPKGLFGKLISLFRRGPATNAQPGNGLPAPPPMPGPMEPQGDSRNPDDATTLTYVGAFSIRDPDPRIDQALFLDFDREFLGGPRPLPQRAAVMRIARMPKEELGLYTERQPSLGLNSLFKMEQRVTKGSLLDRPLLHSLLGPTESEEAVAAHAALVQRRHHKHHGGTHAAEQQLVVGALPSLVEEEEAPEGGRLSHNAHASPAHHHPAQQAPAQGLLGLGGGGPHQPADALLPAMLGAPPVAHSAPAAGLITDPQQAWHALQYHQQGLMQVGALDPNHPNHAMLQAVNDAIQQIAAGGPLPAVGMDGMPLPPGAAPPALRPSPFLDEDGLLTYIADPVKLKKERPARRYDQDKETIKTYRRLPMAEGMGGAVTEGAESYRFDIELGRLEFLVHPSMAQEDLLAARLLSAFKEFKRRETVGLATFYANKLASLEDALLAARERLFELSEQAAIATAAGAPVAAALAQDPGADRELATAAEAVVAGTGMSEDLRAAFDNTLQLEKEVAETRQLKEEEEIFMIRAVETMQSLYASIQAERATQGYWRTKIELTVQQRPPEEQQWAMGTGVPRDRLDTLLLVAEIEAISGLPPPPQPLPLPPAMDGLPEGGFRPRRIECMCASHKMLVSQLQNRLNDLKGRPSSDPEDPIQMQLEDQLRALGAAPRRLGPRTPEQRTMAQEAAAQRVLAGDVGVPRLPRLLPILTVAPDGQPTQGTQQGVPSYSPGADPSSAARTQATHMRGAPPKAKYYIRVLVNNHYVDTSQPIGITEHFTGQFKDAFSIQVVRWPQSITLQLYEKGAVRDPLLATLYVGIPGLSGTPHVDPRPLPYQFTAQVPTRVQGPGSLSPPGSPGRGGVVVSNMVYPAGAVYVRCGWVAQSSGPSTSLDPGVRTFENPLADPQRDLEAPVGIMPPVPRITVDRLLQRAAERIGGKANRQQILRWLSQNKVDPNDPRNAALVELLRAQEATSGGMGDLFRLDVFADIAIPESRQQGKRTSFLSRRWAAGPFRDPERSVLKGTRHVKIPAVLSAKDTEDMEHLYLDALALVELVPGGSGPAIARAMHVRAERAARTQIGAELSRAVEERETRIKQYALRIRTAANRIAGGKQAVRSYKTEDVVNDLPLPEFKVDLSTLSRLLAPRRPLKRERKVLKSLQTSVPPDTELMITIQRATDLPVRRGSAAMQVPGNRARGRRDDADATDQGPRRDHGSAVSAFVEVRFRGMSTRTVTSSAEVPAFNEMMSLPVFGTEEEPSSRALYENSDLIVVNVFDEVIHDKVGEPRIVRSNKEDAISDPVRYPERERRFLGCIRVPLSAVYQTQVLEGTFKLEVPPVMLGYTQRSGRPPCLSMVLSLRPRLAPPAEVPEHLLSGEMEDVTRYTRTWLSELQDLTQCRSRVIKALAVDPDGTSLLVTRFVAPTRLPPHIVTAATTAPVNLPGVSHTEEVMLKAARFVSLLPYLEDSALQKRRVDVWSTSAEALYLAAGDAEEHAHLLAGYFLELGQQAFVVVGASTFGARSYFVLTTGQAEYGPGKQQAFHWNELQLRLWNPLSGGAVSVKDVTGELREVGAVYHHSNVWANIQISGAPWEIHWNLLDSRMWKPLFGYLLLPRELGTVQTPVSYSEQPDLFYEQLETRVEEAARDALSKARAAGAFVTKPDNKISRVLKMLLREMPEQVQAISAASLAASLEVAQLGQSQAPPKLGNGLNERHRIITALQEQHNERVAREARADWVRGCILALPFSDKYIDAIGEAVLNTGLHRIGDEHVKYSVAALVEKGGAAFCCCIWVYVAASR